MQLTGLYPFVKMILLKFMNFNILNFTSKLIKIIKRLIITIEIIIGLQVGGSIEDARMA